MPGKRTPYGQSDYVTERAIYRANLTAVDTAGPQDTAVPVLDTSASPYFSVGMGQSDSAEYGRNAQLDLALLLKGFTAATLQVWLQATVDIKTAYPQGAPPTPIVLQLPATLNWLKVEEFSVTGSALHVLKDIPPGLYKILVTGVTGSGYISILEQHAA